MKIQINFSALNTFDCKYGKTIINTSNQIKIFVVKGLALPYLCIESKSLDSLIVKECSEKETDKIDNLFPYRYIYDPIKRYEYDKWTLHDELLHAKISGTEKWVTYTNKADSKSAMSYEYVGECWFVFEEVTFFKKIVIPNEEGVKSHKIIEEIEFDPVSEKTTQYFLEGGIIEPLLLGWVNMEIIANNFYIEI